MKLALAALVAFLSCFLMAIRAEASTYTISFSGTASGEDYSGVFGTPGATLTNVAYVSTYTLDTGIAEFADFSGPGHNTDFFFGGYTYPTPDPITASITLRSKTFSFDPTATTATGSAFLSDIYDVDPNQLTLSTSAGNNFQLGQDLNLLENNATVANGSVTSSSGEFNLATSAGSELQLNLTATDASTTFPISPAPEPAAWALMLFGVGTLGAVLRARTRQFRQPSA